MGVSADVLIREVIRPTLKYLDVCSSSAEALLLGSAACQSQLGEHPGLFQHFGLWQLSSEQHRALWDGFLAHDPDLASRIRGLASQHAFLENPDLELCVNLRYACALAWMQVVRAARVPALNADLPSLAHTWCKVFAPAAEPRQFMRVMAGLPMTNLTA